MPAAAHLRTLRATLDGPMTLGELAVRLGREGAGLLVVLFAIPFLQPIPLAGLGTPVGLLLAAVGVQLALGHETLPLPEFAARRPLDAAMVARLLGFSERALGILERFARPRWAWAARSPRAYGAAVVVLGLIFAVPLFVPLGNPATALPLLFIGAALVEEDGLLGSLGLVGTAGTVVYHAAFVRLVWTGGRAALTRWS